MNYISVKLLKIYEALFVQVYVCVYLFIYLFIEREREREKERYQGKGRERESKAGIALTAWSPVQDLNSQTPRS